MAPERQPSEGQQHDPPRDEPTGDEPTGDVSELVDEDAGPTLSAEQWEESQQRDQAEG